jgi:hypothetical protein
MKNAARKASMVMWWRSAVSFSCLFLVIASRMRTCACDMLSRLCVRRVLCKSAFLSSASLPSTRSAADRSALFARFAGTIDASDFSMPRFIGFGSSPSR